MYIDTNVLVYAVEGHPKYGGRCRKIIEDINSGRLEVVTSIITLVEFIHVIRKLNRKIKNVSEKIDLKKAFEALMSLPFKWADLDFLVTRLSIEFNGDLSSVDSIHIASMELNRTHEIISADSDFDKLPFIKRIDPLNY